MSHEDQTWFKFKQQCIQQTATDAYQEALDRGIAKEQARFLLPISATSKLHMNGTIRSWVHYINLRVANGTQKEHADIAREAQKIFKSELPIVAKALSW